MKKILLMMFLPMLMFGCGDGFQLEGRNNGDCVYVAKVGDDSHSVIKGVYQGFIDGTHWYTVDDKVYAVSSFYANITSCNNIKGFSHGK